MAQKLSFGKHCSNNFLPHMVGCQLLNISQTPFTSIITKEKEKKLNKGCILQNSNCNGSEIIWQELKQKLSFLTINLATNESHLWTRYWLLICVLTLLELRHSLLQGIFLTQGWPRRPFQETLGLLHWRQILYCLSHQGE